MVKLFFIIVVIIAALYFLAANKDACYDRQAYLWNSNATDNAYEGNEAYWDAVKACK